MKEFAQQFLDVVGVSLAAAIAAMVGAFGALALPDARPSPRQSVWIVFLGVGTGAFGSRLLEWAGLSGFAANAAAFFLALGGMPIAAFVFMVANRLRQRAEGITDRGIDRFLPPGPPPDPPKQP